MQPEMQTEARERLKTALVHMILAAKMAVLDTPAGKAELAIIARKPDGSGVVGASLTQPDDFFDDLARVLGYDDARAFMIAKDD